MTLLLRNESWSRERGDHVMRGGHVIVTPSYFRDLDLRTPAVDAGGTDIGYILYPPLV